MRILVLGAGGYVGTLIRPALEERHECTYLDSRHVESPRGQAFIGDVEDASLLRMLLGRGFDSVIYLVLGTGPRGEYGCDVNFDLNVRALYKAALASLKAGVPQFIYASSLSVYRDLGKFPFLSEQTPPDCVGVYGVSKLLGEQVCGQLALHHPSANVQSIRLMLPRQEHHWTDHYHYDPASGRTSCALGPQDTRRLFMAAVDFRAAGYYLYQATGDLEDRFRPNTLARQWLRWAPAGQ